MFRISAVIIAVLTLVGTTAIDVSVASAQNSAVERCIAKCRAGGTTNRCPYWCESRYR